MRALNLREVKVIEDCAALLPQERGGGLIDDLRVAVVKREAENGGLVEFEISGYERPLYKGQHSFGTEGRVSDVDGADVWMTLYADGNDRLLELEFIRWDGKEIQELQWETLTLFEP